MNPKSSLSQNYTLLPNQSAHVGLCFFCFPHCSTLYQNIFLWHIQNEYLEDAPIHTARKYSGNAYSCVPFSVAVFPLHDYQTAFSLLCIGSLCYRKMVHDPLYWEWNFLAGLVACTGLKWFVCQYWQHNTAQEGFIWKFSFCGALKLKVQTGTQVEKNLLSAFSVFW